MNAPISSWERVSWCVTQMQMAWCMRQLSHVLLGEGVIGAKAVGDKPVLNHHQRFGGDHANLQFIDRQKTSVNIHDQI